LLTVPVAVAPVLPDVPELAVPPSAGSDEIVAPEDPMVDDAAAAEPLSAAPDASSMVPLSEAPELLSTDDDPDDGETLPLAVPAAEPMPDVAPVAEPDAVGPEVPQAARANAKAIGSISFFMLAPLAEWTMKRMKRCIRTNIERVARLKFHCWNSLLPGAGGKQKWRIDGCQPGIKKTMRCRKWSAVTPVPAPVSP
jgi:hypothetical protein